MGRWYHVNGTLTLSVTTLLVTSCWTLLNSLAVLDLIWCVLQVLPHEIVVVEEEHYLDMWDEMHNWVMVDGVNDAPEELAMANTVNIYPFNIVHFFYKQKRKST